MLRLGGRFSRGGEEGRGLEGIWSGGRERMLGLFEGMKMCLGGHIPMLLFFAEIGCKHMLMISRCPLRFPCVDCDVSGLRRLMSWLIGIVQYFVQVEA